LCLAVAAHDPIPDLELEDASIHGKAAGGAAK
jgi:hypothetical protein